MEKGIRSGVTTPHIDGILIAAGFSSRMGRPKALLSQAGKPFINIIIEKMAAVCDRVYVVTGFEAEAIVPAVQTAFKNSPVNDKIIFVHNPDYAQGMLTSLQAGLRRVNEAEWVLYHFVDQPGLPEVFYREFINQVEEGADWIQPRDGQRGGHPVLFNRTLFEAILNLPLTASLKDISQHECVDKKLWTCPWPQIFQDIDEPGDFELNGKI